MNSDYEQQRRTLRRFDDAVHERMDNEEKLRLKTEAFGHPVAAEQLANIGKRMVEAFEPFAAQLRETFDRIAKAIEDNPDLFTGPRGPIHPKDMRDENGIPKPSPVAPFWAQSHTRHSVNRGSNRGRTGGRNR